MGYLSDSIVLNGATPLYPTILLNKAQNCKGVQTTMARVPQVTRTIQTTKVNVLCLDIKEGKPFNKEVTLPRVYKDEQHILKVLKKVVDNDEVKAVHVVDTEVVETLYGMSEQKFIELADILPPRKVSNKEA